MLIKSKDDTIWNVRTEVQDENFKVIFTNQKNYQKWPSAIQQERWQSVSINSKVHIIRIGKSKVHLAKEEPGVSMNHKAALSAFSVAPWHCKVMHKEATRHMQTVRKETSPAWRPQLEECVRAKASQD